MTIYKVDAASLGLLGDDNWLSIVSIYDLAGHNEVQFMTGETTPLSVSRVSRFINHLHAKYIGTYLRSYGGDLQGISVRYIFQGEDCPKNFRSVSWEAQRHWTDCCLVPDFYYFAERGFEDFLPEEATLPAWSSRKDTVVWRGSTTGVVEGADIHAIGFSNETLDRLPRYRLCRLLQQLGEGADVGFVQVVQCPDAERAAIEIRLRDEGLATAYLAQQDMTRSKFLVEIDGNSNSWNFIKRLRLGCCVLQVESPWIQWFSHRIVAWEHYVPVKADLSDLLQQMEWCRTHDQAAQRIAENGRRFALGVRYETEMRHAALDILRASVPLSGDPADAAQLQEVCAAAASLARTWDAAIVGWSSFPEPTWLRTDHGTILGNDADGTIVQLAPDGDLSKAITLFDGDDRWQERLAGLQIDRAGETVSLERAGLFLSAHHDRVSTACDRPEKLAWETFTLIPARS